MHICLLLLSLQLNALATPEMAEYERISEDIKKLSKRNLWEVVEKRYIEMSDLGVQLTYKDYLIGAQAAQERGDIFLTRKRLMMSVKLKQKRSTQRWIEEINEGYGYVTLKTSSSKGSELAAAAIPMDPVQVKSIDFAKDQLGSERHFSGMLPVGEYDFGGEILIVEAGVAKQIDISPKIRRLRKKD